MIREPAARRLAEKLLSGSIVRMEVTPAILDVVAKVIMTFVAADEQAQRTEKMNEGREK